MRSVSAPERDEDDSADNSSQNATPPPQAAPPVDSNPPKSILKPTKAVEERKEPTQKLAETALKPSRKVRDRLEVDDDEIAALEKKLGLKKSKTPKQSNDDGLEDLLGDLGASGVEPTAKRKRTDDEEWLMSKRKKTAGLPRIEDEDKEDDDSDASALDSEDGDSEDDDHDLGVDEEDFEDFDSSHSNTPPPQPKRQRENPYVAPQTSHIEVSAKYIPPSRRSAPANDTELEQRLRRQIQGLLNKLSEANLLSILSDIDKLFQTNPRQYVTSNLIDLLLGLICDRTALNDTFIVLHAGFIAAIYKITGQDFGAQIIEQSISRFDTYYTTASSAGEESKELVNIVSLLSQLYNFQLIASDLIFDLIRTFLSTLTETHTELLLRIVRSSGSQLRTDDPSSLKDIVLLLSRTVSQIPSTSLSVRTRFMIDTIGDLKNNRLKAGVASSAVTAEQLSRMRKTLGTLGTRHSIKASEPLRLTLSDIRNVDKKGKWWLIGASWKGSSASTAPESNTGDMSTSAHDSNASMNTPTDLSSTFLSTIGFNDSNNLTTLARTHQMTTPIRRSIFLTLLTSTDYTEASSRLQKLHLTRAQELEIPRVVLHCVATEERYNPYYAAVVGALCAVDGGRKKGKGWVFSGLGVCGRIAAGDGDAGVDGDGSGVEGARGEGVDVKAVVQQAKFFASLMAKGIVGIGMLKTVEWRGMSEKLRVFIEVLVVSVILSLSSSSTRGTRQHSGDGKLQETFQPALENAALADGLRTFLRKKVAKTDLVRNKRERRRVEDGVRVLLGSGCLGGVRRAPLDDENGMRELEVDDF